MERTCDGIIRDCIFKTNKNCDFRCINSSGVRWIEDWYSGNGWSGLETIKALLARNSKVQQTSNIDLQCHDITILVLQRQQIQLQLHELLEKSTHDALTNSSYVIMNAPIQTHPPKKFRLNLTAAILMLNNYHIVFSSLIWQLLAGFIAGLFGAIAGGGGLITLPTILISGISPHMAPRH